MSPGKSAAKTWKNRNNRGSTAACSPRPSTNNLLVRMQVRARAQEDIPDQLEPAASKSPADPHTQFHRENYCHVPKEV